MGIFVVLFFKRSTFLCAIAGSENHDIGYSHSIREAFILQTIIFDDIMTIMLSGTTNMDIKASYM